MIKKKEATLSHIDEYEKASMVDVNEKDITKRKAIASSKVFLNNTSYKLLKKNKSKKGDILNTARVAGIMASKKTSELIPLCHQLNLEKVDISYNFYDKEN